MSAGIFEGSQFKGADVTPIELPNHVPTSHDRWVNSEIESLVQKGSLAAWSTVADTKTQPRPRICLPLGVEPNKPRLIWDTRYLNSMCKHSPFQMGGVGKVAHCSWKGAQQVTLDHKSGSHNVPLAPESWEYFGLCWRGVYYVWTVLCFGWCTSPYIYHSLSDAVASTYSPKTYPPRRGSMTLDDELPCRTWPQPDRPKERSLRGGGPRTHNLLPLRLLHGLSKNAHWNPQQTWFPRRWLRYGAT